MDQWIEENKASGYVEKIPSSDIKHGVYCVASTNPLYSNHVGFDWSQLHRLLKVEPASLASVDADVEKLLDYGCVYMNKVGGDRGLCTVIEVHEPWRMQPLSEQAKDYSVFTFGGSGDAVYRFSMGPPGQATVRNDVRKMLEGIESQLTASNINVVVFLGSFVLFSDDFTSLLHSTAAVHKALKAAGLQLNIHRSSLSPQRMLPSSVLGKTRSGWSLFPIGSLTSDEDCYLITTDLFFQWLQDAYEWKCQPPVQVFPSVGDRKPPTASTGSQGEAAVEDILARKRMRLFEVFVRQLLLPATHITGFKLLQESMPEEGGDLFAECAPLVKAKRVLVGPQKWSTLDLRLILCQVGAYERDPRDVFGELKSSP